MSGPAGGRFVLDGVGAGYGGARDALSGIGLTLPPGKAIALLGENGSGKSTLLKVLAGLLPVRRGTVLFDGRPLASVPRREAALRIGYLPQSFEPFFPATALEVALLGRTPRLGPLGSPRPADLEAARRALAEVDAAALAGVDIGEMSGGEKQRVLLARVLAGEPEVLLLDEPAANLDPRHRLLVIAAIRARAAAGGTVVFSTHELDVAAAAASEAVLLKSGRLVAAGPLADTLTAPLLTGLFGVDASVATRAGGRLAVSLEMSAAERTPREG